MNLPEAFHQWPGFLLNSIVNSRAQFAGYVKAGMSCCRGPKRTSAELFPIPVPFPRFLAELSCKSRRRHQRWKARRALEILVNLQVAALNFSFGKSGPWGYGLSSTPEHHKVVQNLWVRGSSLSRLGSEYLSGCGSRISSASSELEVLHELFGNSSEPPYGQSGWASSKRTNGDATAAVPVVANNVAFPSELKGFDPIPFLPEHMAKAYHSPSELVGYTEGVKPRMKPPECVSLEQRRELLALGFRWDLVNRLYLATPEEIHNDDRSNVFCLVKPDGELRQIIDRRARNARELPPTPNGTPFFIFIHCHS